VAVSVAVVVDEGRAGSCLRRAVSAMGGGSRNDLLSIGYGDGDVNGYGHGVPRGG